jgi:16S rRNA (cytosine1402-N4)-methyltransferase
MGDSDISGDIAGGSSRHVPVMLNEVLAVLDGTPASSTRLRLVDGTFGAGGYSKAFLERGHLVLAIDRDPDTIRDGQELVRKNQDSLTLVKGTFSDMATIAKLAGFGPVDGVILDIGVSSMQIDQAERGFSFQKDGPLDMRMSQSGVSAADVVNNIAQPDLTRLLGLLGEERRASHVARAIVRERDASAITTTDRLAGVVEKTLGRKPGDKIHPATRTFQALRIFVNQELEELGKALFAAEQLLCEGGRLIVVTFHSLEDRMVKHFFRNRAGTQQGSRHLPLVNQDDATFRLEGKGFFSASREEAQNNPRARSAKLRWGERTSKDFRNADMSIFGLPSLASLATLQSPGGQ